MIETRCHAVGVASVYIASLNVFAKGISSVMSGSKNTVCL